MDRYTIFQWLMLFYLYCFFGWCFESTYVSLKQGRFVNRGFMRGPFLPIYGSGAIMMLVVSMPVRDSLVLTYITGMMGATALEYVTGVVMEALFKVRYWDYSNQKFQFQGHICLTSSLAWGVFTILLTRVIHGPVETLMLRVPDQVLYVLVLLLTVVVAADYALSFKAALDIRDILVGLEKAREEIHHMQRRLDVIIAVAEDEMQQRKEAIEESVEETKDAIADRVEDVFERLRRIPEEYLENVKEEIAELSQKYRVVSESRRRIATIRDKYKKHILTNNPITSVRFRDALEEIKERLDRK